MIVCNDCSIVNDIRKGSHNNKLVAYQCNKLGYYFCGKESALLKEFSILVQVVRLLVLDGVSNCRTV